MHSELLMRAILLRLIRYKAKSFFMMLGVVVSVTAIVLVQSIGTGLERKFTGYITGVYPADTVYLAAGNGFMGGGYGAEKLKLRDIKAIVNNLSGIADYAPVVYGGRNPVTSGDNNALVSIVGSSHLADIANNRSVSDGRFFSKADMRRKAKVAIIGSTAARRLFPNDTAIGQTLFYNKVKFTIIGEFETVGADPHGNDRDNDLHIPYTTLMDRILKRDYLSGVTFMLQDHDAASVDHFVEALTDTLRQVHDIRANQQDDFSVIAPKHMLSMVADVFSKFAIVVPILTVIVFGITAIVIFNIMLLTVKERTAEIGLRKALGAQAADIRLQLLLETTVLALFGIVIGVLLSELILYALAPVFASQFGIQQLHLQWSATLTGATAAIIASLLGTWVPARRAANLTPVAALS